MEKQGKSILKMLLEVSDLLINVLGSHYNATHLVSVLHALVSRGKGAFEKSRAVKLHKMK